MVIHLSRELEAALAAAAGQRGLSPEELALAALRQRFLPPAPIEPRDEWERALFSAAIDCGVSPPDSAFDRESLYE
jgi:hypothetical protein